MSDSRPVSYVAEFLGTFILVLIVTMVVSIFAPGQQFLTIGIVHAFILLMLIQTLGNVSGAHFNPAVTCAMLAIRRIKPPDAILYIVFQLAGAVCGALFTKAILLDEGKAVNYGATTVSDALSGAFAGLVVEGVFTFLLMWAIVGVATNPRAARDWAGWVIGATLGLLVIVGAPLTGASLNPARSFGPALVSGTWTDFWIYIVGPVAGAVVAALAYYYLFIRTHEKVETRIPDVE